MDAEKRKKMIVVGIVAVVAIGVLVWGLTSYFGGSAAPAPVDPTVQQQLEQMQAEAEKARPPSAPPPGPTEKGSPNPFLGPAAR
jgi:hypothetical protein